VHVRKVSPGRVACVNFPLQIVQRRPWELCFRTTLFVPGLLGPLASGQRFGSEESGLQVGSVSEDVELDRVLEAPKLERTPSRASLKTTWPRGVLP